MSTEDSPDKSREMRLEGALRWFVYLHDFHPRGDLSEQTAAILAERIAQAKQLLPGDFPAKKPSAELTSRKKPGPKPGTPRNNGRHPLAPMNNDTLK